MTKPSLSTIFKNLSESLKGEFYIDETHKILYATDASAYREKPLAVAIPKDKEDLKCLIKFANENRLSLIPRAAGTSLAGQVVGNGVVVDISKHFNQILELNVEEKWVRVQPGVVRDELNMFLKKHQLFFAPETSTSNRCMMGGMLGNNACGAHSLVYGSTREHTKSVKVILSDGSEAVFSDLSGIEFDKKLIGNALENKIYQNIDRILSDTENQKEIIEQFPDPQLERRNTGYALDLLLRSEKFDEGKAPFNFSKLLAGSEGTLAFTTEITLNLVPLPPVDKALICVHLSTVEEALKANLIALKYKPVSIELMDKAIMDLTKSNKAQAQNRFFVQGDPGAILIVEFAEKDMAVISQKAADMEADMRSAS
ncbi:MAG: FAD-binding oxidoreductase, partial [Bacteroidales bacterium]|nr:FAD-binding oxidoreductase [Bacteroidales bacterium]